MHFKLYADIPLSCILDIYMVAENPFWENLSEIIVSYTESNCLPKISHNVLDLTFILIMVHDSTTHHIIQDTKCHITLHYMEIHWLLLAKCYNISIGLTNVLYT
jgi:hypothetical protein